MKTLYTAYALATGDGRDGHVRSLRRHPRPRPGDPEGDGRRRRGRPTPSSSSPPATPPASTPRCGWSPARPRPTSTAPPSPPRSASARTTAAASASPSPSRSTLPAVDREPPSSSSSRPTRSAPTPTRPAATSTSTLTVRRSPPEHRARSLRHQTPARSTWPPARTAGRRRRTSASSRSAVPDPAVRARSLVRNLFMSVDPYMRGRMNDVKSYVPPFAARRRRWTAAPSARSSPRAPTGSRVGDTVLHDLGWREYAVAGRRRGPHGRPERWPRRRRLPRRARHDRADRVRRAARRRRAEARRRRLRLRRRRRRRQHGRPDRQAQGRLPGDRQRRLGRRRWRGCGARLRRRVRLPRRPGPRPAEGRRARTGIDVYFDNVGGDHLEAAISAMQRCTAGSPCAARSPYNATEPPPAPRNLALAIGKRLTLRGFIVSDHADMRRPFVAEGRRLAARRRARPYDETVVDGLENAPQAFIGPAATATTPARCSSASELAPPPAQARTVPLGPRFPRFRGPNGLRRAGERCRVQRLVTSSQQSGKRL